MINKLTIIGVGLIGGSLAQALKKANYVKKIVGYSHNQESLTIAQELNVIDEGTLTMAEALDNADVVILAVPVDGFTTVFESIKPHLNNKMILSDVGSTKGSVITAAKKVFGTVPTNLIPAHPIAGKEKSGVKASEAGLFIDKRVILTPDTNADDKAISTIKAMWQATGAHVEKMSVNEHDLLLAAASHLPHMLAYALVDNFLEHNPNVFNYTGGGFKNFSRIASSNAQMWRDVCLNNGDNIIKQIETYQQSLDKLKELIVQADKKGLEKLFATAKKARDSHLAINNKQ